MRQAPSNSQAAWSNARAFVDAATAVSPVTRTAYVPTEAERLARLNARSRENIARMQGSMSAMASIAPWAGRHGGRKADPSTSAVVVDEPSIPDGAHPWDRAREGWAGAWQRQNTTRAGKSERRSVLVGSQRGATRLG